MKLEAIGPEEKDKEWDVLHLEACCIDSSRHQDRKGRGQIRVSPYLDIRGGREDSLLEAIWSRAVLLPVQSGMKGETVKWVVYHGGKGGQVIRDSRGDGSGCVAEEQDDLQEGFFFRSTGNVFNCQSVKAGEVGGKAQSTFKGVEGLML